jgi:hypothetical protein
MVKLRMDIYNPGNEAFNILFNSPHLQANITIVVTAWNCQSPWNLVFYDSVTQTHVFIKDFRNPI